MRVLLPKPSQSTSTTGDFPSKCGGLVLACSPPFSVATEMRCEEQVEYCTTNRRTSSISSTPHAELRTQSLTFPPSTFSLRRLVGTLRFFVMFADAIQKILGRFPFSDPESSGTRRGGNPGNKRLPSFPAFFTLRPGLFASLRSLHPDLKIDSDENYDRFRRIDDLPKVAPVDLRPKLIRLGVAIHPREWAS